MCSKSYPGGDQINDENLRLKSAIEELSILNDIATAIASTYALDQITNLIVKKCVKHLKAEQGSIQLVNEKDSINPFHTMIRVKDSKRNIEALRFDQQISNQMMATKKPIMINKFHHKEKIALQNSTEIKVKSLLSVPMIIKGKMIGILSLFNKESNPGFTEADQRLLSIIAAQSANVIENSRLFEEEQKLKLIQKEINVASEIQKNLLPHEIPLIKNYDIYAVNKPAWEVGGDYYDFIRISETKTAIALGDVSGKGLPAAMLMANLQATLRGQLLFSSCVKDCIQRANNLLHKSTSVSKFVTLFFGVLDTNINTFTYCNAGHNIPIFLQGGKRVELNKGGIILSWKENANYEEEEIIFEKGSILCVYSDGVTEAKNENEEEFGEERLFDLMHRKSDLTSRHLVTEVLNDLNKFTAGTSQSDDITLLIIKRNN